MEASDGSDDEDGEVGVPETVEKEIEAEETAKEQLGEYS